MKCRFLELMRLVWLGTATSSFLPKWLHCWELQPLQVPMVTCHKVTCLWSLQIPGRFPRVRLQGWRLAGWLPQLLLMDVQARLQALPLPRACHPLLLPACLPWRLVRVWGGPEPVATAASPAMTRGSAPPSDVVP